ncbi:MAG: aminoacyl-tRNA hydrolase [Candidatus Portnoybacteria bacterium CG06_land_8_20_14_3_00_39_12]|uniref:Peptidyl-tRNA hydrolase n=2 Tax=Candidatus Portnoyibacteriota TaxID=1817913 RepID=A0A2M8KGZ9_9BACT|nr:MAG: aminoacyl-tRNA hydrolase [Parcubacteria group bacterium CG1_02_40_25]PIU75107.1 MAG: aminoacyl-tRNA hydrolase [Candidatus Portnoybacteria bacterium CG06_land_8_20_14_3_00_39_12]PJE59195.1 MAG: aminoacyl-tRNA hydrolase [Candidatus Portnoybacteria bacterium CG10_big_fil_rev_8_21_14_0_10_40_22]
MVKLIVGLGNPDQKLQNTRHNFGFMVIDAWAKNSGIGFVFNKKFNALIAQNREQKFLFPTDKVILAKPQTMMNNSGQSIKKICQYFKIKPEEILVAHDENDLPFGNLKLIFDKSTAGHRGVESIINQLKTQAFFRLRLGIAPQASANLSLEDFVLHDFNPQEQQSLPNIIKKATEIISATLDMSADNPDQLISRISQAKS